MVFTHLVLGTVCCVLGAVFVRKAVISREFREEHSGEMPRKGPLWFGKLLSAILGVVALAVGIAFIFGDVIGHKP
jgi:hypothetical protein